MIKKINNIGFSYPGINFYHMVIKGGHKIECNFFDSDKKPLILFYQVLKIIILRRRILEMILLLLVKELKECKS